MPTPQLVSRKLKAVTMASDNPDTRMQSLSMQTAIFEKSVIKNSRGRNAFAGAGPERAKMVEQIRATVVVS